MSITEIYKQLDNAIDEIRDTYCSEVELFEVDGVMAEFQSIVMNVGHQDELLNLTLEDINKSIAELEERRDSIINAK